MADNVTIPRILVQNMIEQAYCDGMKHERANPLRNHQLTRTVAGIYARNQMPKFQQRVVHAARKIEQEREDER